MVIFDYIDYKKFVNAWIGSQPRKGHGQLRQLALYLKINSVVMSQVFRGDRELTLEQALMAAKYIALGELETEYFLVLVNKARAGTYELKALYETQSESLKIKSSALKNRIKHQKLTDEHKATFFSKWYYSAVRLGVSIPKLNSVNAVADHLSLDRMTVSKVVDFLLSHKLIVEEKGCLDIGPKITHTGHDSPFVTRHHTNWRLKGLQSMESSKETDLYYTGPMALSNDAAEEIRNLLVDVIEKSTKKAAPSNSEVLRCLNIDWFGFGKS